LETVTVNIDVAAFRAISDAPRGTTGVVLEEGTSTSTTTPPSPTNATGDDGQGSFLPDPIEETWNAYVTALDRPKAVLTPKVRKWIADAHQAVGADQTREAIRGLAASDYHREHGYVGIEYAIVPKRGQTIEGRIEQMAARAANASQRPEGGRTIKDIVANINEDYGQFYDRTRGE
jgi:hypothetical protein